MAAKTCLAFYVMAAHLAFTFLSATELSWLALILTGIVIGTCVAVWRMTLLFSSGSLLLTLSLLVTWALAFEKSAHPPEGSFALLAGLFCIYLIACLLVTLVEEIAPQHCPAMPRESAIAWCMLAAISLYTVLFVIGGSGIMPRSLRLNGDHCAHTYALLLLASGIGFLLTCDETERAEACTRRNRKEIPHGT